MRWRWGRIGLFCGGALASTLGVRILRSRDAKKVYAFALSALLREKDYIMDGVTEFREECGDVLADAKERNERLAEEREQVIENRAARKEETGD